MASSSASSFSNLFNTTLTGIPMIEFEVSKEFSLSPNLVWGVVREVKDYPKYWHGTRELNVKKVKEGVFEG